jgi:murein L,D-transpeptidase YcbB/YkuD
LLERADRDDLDPNAYHPVEDSAAIAAAGRGDPASLAHAEIALSRAFAGYVGDLRRPPPSAKLQFVDPAVRLPRSDAAGVLEEAAGAPSLAAALRSARHMNPIYMSLRDALTQARARGEPASVVEAIRINLERARALPPDLGRRYILVNPAAENLWLYEDGAPKAAMRVVVGKLDQPTPAMIGVVRYALFNPYWNVPPDLVRDRLAPAVLRDGVGYLRSQGFEAMSDWSATARVLDPASVDWAAVGAGRRVLRVRQRPGPDNMMGRVKFMLPNPLGIYLHDTPERALFANAERADSAGCVRLQHPDQLAGWLFGRPVSFDPSGGPDQRVDLPSPVPLYILYLTRAPGPTRLAALPDLYSRDPGALDELRARSARDSP